MVNASVSTASSTGQEMLHRELPFLDGLSGGRKGCRECPRCSLLFMPLEPKREAPRGSDGAGGRLFREEVMGATETKARKGGVE